MMTTMAIGVSAMLLCSLGAQGGGRNGVPPELFGRLQKGINLSHWFSQWHDLSPERFTTYVTERDMDLIRRAGFDHVRLPFNPEPFWEDGPQGPSVKAEPLGHYRRAVGGFVRRGLAVIVDMHPEDGFKDKLAKDPAFARDVERFWRAFAGRLADTDPNFVVFEILNEPSVDSRGAKDPVRLWAELNLRFARAIRAAAPRHTIVASGGGWTGVDQFDTLEPIRGVGNVVYNFHCYDPFVFTHQGATWGWELSRFMRGVPYPSSPEAVQDAIRQSDPRVRDVLTTYGNERWNLQRLRAHLKRAADWASRHRVYLTCNEFGVYIPNAPRESRLAWLRDMTTVLREYGIGWTMWDYAGGFAVAVGEPGSRRMDQGVLRALGL
ncbi:MAG: glycoside hydrolase family 5 protein [Fimbriimonadales bacterium]|nr:glycoside hydrolase family 5 protein [Fimbriimonadales bacterium]